MTNETVEKFYKKKFTTANITSVWSVLADEF